MDPNAFDVAVRMSELAAQYLRPSTGAISWNGTSYEPLFDPPLTAEEQATYDALFSLSRSAVHVTPEEWAGLRNEIDGLRTYHGLATPTNAQSVAAIKAIIRVLRAILRD
jgi:hypothetical protein